MELAHITLLAFTVFSGLRLLFASDYKDRRRKDWLRRSHTKHGRPGLVPISRPRSTR